MRNADQLFLHGRSIAIPSENEDDISGRFTRETTQDHIDVTPDGDEDAPAGGCIPCSRQGSAQHSQRDGDSLFSKQGMKERREENWRPRYPASVISIHGKVKCPVDATCQRPGPEPFRRIRYSRTARSCLAYGAQTASRFSLRCPIRVTEQDLRNKHRDQPMNKIFKQMLSSQTPSHAAGTTQAAQYLADTDLAGIAGGIEHGEIQFEFGLHYGSADKALPFSDELQQLPIGALDPHTVPWVELTPPVKKLASAGWIIP
jgi:hypothetical protein